MKLLRGKGVRWGWRKSYFATLYIQNRENPLGTTTTTPFGETVFCGTDCAQLTWNRFPNHFIMLDSGTRMVGQLFGWTTFDLTFGGLARSSRKGDHEGVQFVTQLLNHQDVTVRINTGIGTRCSGLRLDHGAPVWQSQFSHLHSNSGSLPLSIGAAIGCSCSLQFERENILHILLHSIVGFCNSI